MSRPSSSKPQRRLMIALLVAMDVVTLGAGFWVANLISIRAFGVATGIATTEPVRLGLLVAYLLIFSVYGVYSASLLSSGGTDYRLIGNANGVGLVAAIVIAGWATDWHLDPRALLVFWLCVTFATLVGRFTMRRLIFSEQRRGREVERTLILGANSEGIAIAIQLGQSGRTGSRVLGFLDDFKTTGEEPVPGLKIIGPLSELETLIETLNVDSVLIASPTLLNEFLAREDRALEILSRVEVKMAWGGFDLLTTGVRVKEEGNVPLVVLNKTRIKGIHMVLKTLLDYAISALALVLLFPFFLLLYILIRFDSPGPVVHKRGVIGIGGKRFYAYKFRTMFVNGDAMMTPEMKEEWRVEGKIKNDPRITRTGAFLRKFSLDELPQLINVVKGEMSLVGPRMITPAEMQRFGRWQHSRNFVKPGMTGLWQISGRSDLSYDDRAKLDIYYIRNHSIWLDLQILLKTIPALLSSRGAY